MFTLSIKSFPACNCDSRLLGKLKVRYIKESCTLVLSIIYKIISERVDHQNIVNSRF